MPSISLSLYTILVLNTYLISSDYKFVLYVFLYESSFLVFLTFEIPVKSTQLACERELGAIVRGSNWLVYIFRDECRRCYL